MSAQTHLNKPKILSSGALFATLDTSELESFAQFASVQTFDGGEVVCAEGGDGDAMYIVAIGRVTISLAAVGKEITVGTLGQGDAFGEISLLDGKRRTATVRTMEPSELLSIRREDVLAYLQAHPLVAIKLLAALAGRFRVMDELIKDTLAINLPSKLAKALLKLAQVYGYSTSRGVKIDVKLYEEELAYRLAVGKEKITAQLDAWIEEGLLEIRKYRLVILNPYKFAMLV